MSRRERFTPYEKEQACLDYINGNRSRSEICNCLHISTRTIQDWAAIYKKYGILGFTKKTKNSSYSKEFKMELVEKCISGEARMYNANIELKDYNPKREVYMAKAKRKTTIDERKEIVNYCIEHNRNYKETASLYDVSYSQVYSWVKKYDSDGEEGLVDKRGHHKLDDEVDELERLRRENVRLKRQLEEKDMTVELLKKVKEFGRM
ncbi:helix-turn-helix domain-containing protein [Streptococcus salivarius]|uniref:helix-turn-helix domain-containing protein n=1 Tax=Streptococcus salivarius TaxID=1304 RepID=UPI001C038B80|nr:helix-turn-helix domain-containing protein [Streptococcus salivarius]MBT9629990.1 helix-turn-helix domain-containing protein [Streptococcus salivarius]